jgi:hypothetical protein
VKRARDNATTKALIGEHIDKNVKVGDHLTAAPTNKARERMYRSASKGALKTHGGHIESVRTAQNRWMDDQTNQYSTWDPASLKDELKKQASSPATRVGRRAGGTSNTRARIGRGRNQLKAKWNKK